MLLMWWLCFLSVRFKVSTAVMLSNLAEVQRACAGKCSPRYRVKGIRRVYVHGSVHRKSILINVQRDATICSLYFILLQYHSTCFGCRPHPSSGVHKTSYSHWYKSYDRAATSLQRGQIHLATLERGGFTIMTCTSGCNYSFMYS